MRLLLGRFAYWLSWLANWLAAAWLAGKHGWLVNLNVYMYTLVLETQPQFCVDSGIQLISFPRAHKCQHNQELPSSCHFVGPWGGLSESKQNDSGSSVGTRK